MSYSFAAKEENYNDQRESGVLKKSSDGKYYNTVPQDEYDNVEPHMCSPLSCFAGLLCLPISIFSCLVTNPKEEVVVLDYGKYNGTLKDPGCHWVCNSGRTVHRISTKIKSIKIPETKTIDKNGNPLVINGILAYKIRNSKRAALDVDNYGTFVWTQALAAMKQIVSKYPYEAEDGICLKATADVIAQEMVGILQERVAVAGIEILSFTFNEMSYAPEIASGMLKKQQATAMLQARNTIVKGAVEITNGVIRELTDRGMQLDDEAKTRIVSNLLTVICTDGSAYT